MVKPFEKPVYVTQPVLPPFEKFCERLGEIWDNRRLTNNGPIVQRYAKRLCEYLELDHVCLFNNGTLALQIALQGMRVSGEVITTPFTFVATAHAMFWNAIRPVFVDIEPDYYTLDPEKVEAAITPWTTAIVPVHVYGHPCQLDALADIARRRGLHLIYDAAHAFGVRVAGKPIAHYGDLNMFSFHATKLYHSIEGGMLTFKNPGFKKTFDYLKNFGFENEMEVVIPGTNAKMNEFQALMGELILDEMPTIIAQRKQLCERYRQLLADVPGIRFPPPVSSDVEYNYAYMPIEVDAARFGLSRDGLYEELKKFNLFTRRYFYPLVCDFACYRSVSVGDPLTVARSVAARILTLPIYSDLTVAEVEQICEIIRHVARGAACC